MYTYEKNVTMWQVLLFGMTLWADILRIVWKRDFGALLLFSGTSFHFQRKILSLPAKET